MSEYKVWDEQAFYEECLRDEVQDTVSMIDEKLKSISQRPIACQIEDCSAVDLFEAMPWKKAKKLILSAICSYQVDWYEKWEKKDICSRGRVVVWTQDYAVSTHLYVYDPERPDSLREEVVVVRRNPPSQAEKVMKSPRQK
jgi:hypothetical protein